MKTLTEEVRGSNGQGQGAISVAHVCTIDVTARKLLLPQLLALRDEGFDVAVVCAPGPDVNELTRRGIRHVAWPSATRAWAPLTDLKAFTELLRIFRRERFDVVHTHNPKPGILGRIAARAAGVPHVINTVHGYYATPDDRIARRLPVMIAEWLASRLSHVELFQSQEDLTWAERVKVARPGRALYVGNGVDLTRFPAPLNPGSARELRRDLGIAEGELVVGTVGRMVCEKGYAEFFEAARAVRDLEPNVRFLAVGDASFDKRDAINPEQIDAAREDVIFVGWREDIPQIMGLMDVFVLPSWREGLPRSAIEAAASGLPLVLTDIRGCREVVRPEIEGLLVPPRDPDRLASAILELVRDPAMRKRMGEAARARAEAMFDERRVISTVVRATDARRRVKNARPAGARSGPLQETSPVGGVRG